MASNEEKKDEKKRSNIINQSLQQLNKIIGKSNLSLYGTDRISDVDKLNNQLHKLKCPQLVVPLLLHGSRES